MVLMRIKQWLPYFMMQLKTAGKSTLNEYDSSLVIELQILWRAVRMVCQTPTVKKKHGSLAKSVI